MEEGERRKMWQTGETGEMWETEVRKSWETEVRGVFGLA